MDIRGARIDLSADHVLRLQRTVSERVSAWRGPNPADRPAPALVPAVDTASLSPDARALATAASGSTAVATDAGETPELSLIRALIEALTGETVRVFDASALTEAVAQARDTPQIQDPNAATADAVAANAPPADPGFGVEAERHVRIDESETTRFTASGEIHTADGRILRFSLNLEMSREFHLQSDSQLLAGNARRKDPLVVNFAGNAAALTDRRFRFDLDADGTAESLAMLAGGSGYLAIDRNGNGRIDDGRELFGTQSGDGFADLAALDADGDGWVDAADPGFATLRIWQPAADGAGTLTTLAAQGIAALSTQAVATSFALRGTGNADLGAVRSTGVYVREDGSAGTAQQIDLTV